MNFVKDEVQLLCYMAPLVVLALGWIGLSLHRLVKLQKGKAD